MTRARKFVASATDRALSLAELVAHRLGISPGEARARIAGGAIWVDRARALDPDAAVRAGQKVTAREPEAAVEPLAMVHQDDDAIVLDKPAGVPSQATRAGIESAETWLRRHEPEARLVHRLDREASGLLLFARRPAANARFRRILDEGALERRYRSVVWGHPVASSRVIDRPIGPDPRDRRRQAVNAGGKPARTEMTVVRTGTSAQGNPITLIELRLVTGRTHQIRVHMASIGHPVCGDSLYSWEVERERVERLALHAAVLAWPGVTVRSPSPLNVAALADVLGTLGT